MNKNVETVLHDTVRATEDGHIFIEPVCDFFEISYVHQKRKIAEDAICQSGSTKKYCQSLFGDKRLRLCVDKRAFIRWIQIISVQIVHPKLQKTFEEYQVAVFDYLYSGNEKRVAQLEDIRQYALNINEAIRIKNHVMEYISEQKNHRDLCLQTPPDMWPDVKQGLAITKEIPAGVNLLKPQLPANIGQLKLMKKNAQTNLGKHQHMIDYQKKTVEPEPNPMPDGYRREMHKLYVRNYQDEIMRIDARIMELTGVKTLEG